MKQAPVCCRSVWQMERNERRRREVVSGQEDLERALKLSWTVVFRRVGFMHTRPATLRMLHVAKKRIIAQSRNQSTQQAVLQKLDLMSRSAFITVNYSDGHGDCKEGPLFEKWIAVKDNICTKDMKTTCSSNMLKTFYPGYDATVVELLLQNGARILGKTNGDEFGMGSLSIHSPFRRVINPYQPKTSPPSSSNKSEWRSAGGSSGGSAAAATYKICFAALGTDTGGSTRLPASYCGVAGFKPSYGLISRWGVIAFADSLDTVGILSSEVKNIKSVFGVVARYDERDPTSIPDETRRAAHDACKPFCIPEDAKDLTGLRIGIPQEYFPAELGDTVIKPFRRILKALKQRGASLLPVSLPSTKYALSAYYVLSSAEASSNMARYDGIRFGVPVPLSGDADLSKASRLYAYTRTIRFATEVKKRILLGTYALTADAFDNYYLKAQELRKLIRRDFNNIFRMPNVLQPSEPTNQEGVDVLLHPTAIRTAPLFSEISDEGLNTYVQDVLTVPASLAGIPAMSVPSIADDGWPVGTSVVGQWGSDEVVLRVAEIMESIISQESLGA